MKILVTGSSGQLGQAIILQQPKHYQILSPRREELDLLDYLSCKKYIEFNKPDFVINCGAYTNVDLAEKEKELCYAINTVAPITFAKVLRDIGGNLLQISTDYVFDGRKNFAYKEYDERNKGRCNIRGVKVRGVFQSKEEADARASRLHKTDKNFHVFVGQVGYWLPFNPNPDKIDEEHFGDDQLNDLMQKYKENSVNKDIFYEEQKREKIKASQEERLRAERERKSKESLENVSEEPEPENVSDEPEPESVPKVAV